MSAPTFTQGPWIVLARESRPGMAHEGYFRINGMTEDCEPEYHVATVIDANDLSQNEANARLIAAAPDLYAALSNLLADLAPIVNEFHNSKVNGAWPPAPGDARALASELTRISVPARAALAKAQGAQS